MTKPRAGAPLSTVKPQNYGSVSHPGAAIGLTAAGVAGGAALAGNARSTGGDISRSDNSAYINGPRGEFGAIRGPGGGVVAAADGPGGNAVAGIRGPRGNWIVDDVPGGCNNINWGGHDYWYHGHYWYAPVWYDDDWYWEYRYPPTGYYYETLPENYETVVVDDETYYSSDSVYYQAETNGYVVVPPPSTNSAGEALAVLRSTCDYLGSVTSFTAEVDITTDRYLESGDKVPVSSHRVIRVKQPDHAAVDLTGASMDQRLVYDGKTVMVTDRLTGRFTMAGAPARLEDAIPDLRAKRNQHMPFGDLLQRDAFDTISIGLKTAEYVGLSKIGAEDCHHVAFTQDELDWELWVSAGVQPLPMKIVINYRQSPNSPRYTWECRKWEINQPQPANAFADERTRSPAPAPAG